VQEAKSIALASSRKLMVILDDKAARSFAEVIRITFLGIAGLLFHAFVKKHLTLAELADAVGALSQTIWLSPAVVSDILRKARETCGVAFICFPQEAPPCEYVALTERSDNGCHKGLLYSSWGIYSCCASSLNRKSQFQPGEDN
jgi:hypothetical protein